MRHSSLRLKRRAAVLINTLVAVIVLMGATAPLSAQEPLNLINPLSYGSAFTEATLAAGVRGIGANPRTLVVPPGTWQIRNDLEIPAHVHILPATGAQFTVSRGRTLTIQTLRGVWHAWTLAKVHWHTSTSALPTIASARAPAAA